MQQIRTSRSKVVLLAAVCLLSACAERQDYEASPEAAKKFLKLRGYDFEEASFFRAASASDAIAINGFITAGINPNARDENGDTALTAAAARGDLQIVNVLLKAGADANAKGRNDWTALLLALKEDRVEVADRLLSQADVDVKGENPD